ncbi:MAG TPA: hypothetical protein VGE21_05910 [Flavobacteriales bacterium]
MRTTLLFCLALLLTACDDLIERDIDGYGVVLLTPLDGQEIRSNVVAFRWEEVPYASEYVFQVASPNFSSPVDIVTDSLVTVPRIDLPLAPGTYTWRVKARNTNSGTGYYTRQLTVLQSDSIDDLTPILVAPGQAQVLSTTSVLFQWQAVQGAEDHRFELRQGGQTGPLINAQLISGTEVTINDIPEGALTWGVQGQSGGSSSQFNYRSLHIDRTAPAAPVLLAPNANASVPNSTTTFTWQSGTDLSTTTDSFFVMDDDVVIRSILASGTSYADSLGSGTYQWFVRTRDVAGNTTGSTPRTLTVQ